MRFRFNVWMLTGLILAALITACAPASSPTLSLPAPSAEPPTPEPPTPEPTPTIAPVTLAGPQAGTELAWTDGSVLVYVPASEFMMGSGLPDAPQHPVSLDSYWIYKTEVTNGMYAFCVKVGACAPPARELGAPLYDNPIYANYPVVGISWDMAANYCKWIGGNLPTEAQWEKAARGVSGNLYPWGNQEPSCDLGNFSGCVGALTDATKYGAGASPYGALDMAGNVFEWVNDFYGANYYNSAPLQNPAGPESGEMHVIRSNSYESDFEQAGSALRHYGGSAYHSRDLGFRCVVQNPPALAPMCQLSSYIPSVVVAEGACQVPDVSIGSSYCEFNKPQTSVKLPAGAVYEVRTKGYTCAEAVVDGQRILTCTGPDDTTGEVTVCNPTCSSLPEATGASPTCDPGYGLDANNNCLYSPVPAEPTVAGCLSGYTLLERGGQKTCVVGRGGDGLCPDGMYFDSAYGACASPSGGANLPVGLDNPEQAAQAYQGCLPGFSYSPEYQCCQPSLGGVYPGCPLGSRYEAALQTCVPAQLRLGGPGCVTISVNMLRCGEPYQVELCGGIKTETGCIKNQVYDCKWDEARGLCYYAP